MKRTPKVRIRELEKRMAFLDSRVNDPTAYSESARNYRMAELGALVWAVPILCEMFEVEQVVFPIENGWLDHRATG